MDEEKVIYAGSEDDCETIKVYLTPSETPKAYATRVNDLIKSGCEKEKAEKIALEPIELELFYEEGRGLFAVESEATECYGTCCSPYTGTEIEPYED